MCVGLCELSLHILSTRSLYFSGLRQPLTPLALGGRWGAGREGSKKWSAKTACVSEERSLEGGVEAPKWAVTGQSSVPQVLFLPTSLGEAEQTFIITCDNCQIKELVTSGGLVCAPQGWGSVGPRAPPAAALAL